ncbi:MAG: hypothetical protein ACM3ON_06765 [Chloroflexota bacterium]
MAEHGDHLYTVTIELYESGQADVSIIGKRKEMPRNILLLLDGDFSNAGLGICRQESVFELAELLADLALAKPELWSAVQCALTERTLKDRVIWN